MAIRINGTNHVGKILSNLRKVSEDRSELLGKMSSGKRVEKAADDAASMALGTKINAFVRSQRAATRNANDGVSFVQTAEGGLEEISNILIRLRELTVQAGSDTLGDRERSHLDQEYQQLVEEVDRIALSTSFNGTNVINGDQGVLRFQVGPYAADSAQIEFDTTGTFTDADSIGIGGTNVSEKETALESIESIDGAIDEISMQRAKLGAVQNRMNHAISALEDSILAHENTRSKMVDLDYGHGSAELAAKNMITETATRSLAVANQIPKSALKLIG